MVFVVRVDACICKLLLNLEAEEGYMISIWSRLIEQKRSHQFERLADSRRSVSAG